MNCLIVDDDDLIRIDLERRISEKPFLTLVGSCSSAPEALELLMQKQVDLVFLDIMMPGMTGLQLVESLAANHPQVIFITSEEQFAVKAFEYDATDFLVKPVSEERFLKAVVRALGNYRKSHATPGAENDIFVKVKNALVKIQTDEILFIESLADYVTIHTTAKTYTIHSTMREIQNSLPDAAFFRVHNSFIVSLNKISQIEDNMVLIDKKLIPVSRSRFKPLMQRLNLLS